MKKSILLLALLVPALMFVGCHEEANTATFKVGMVTDAGTIDDKSFNQGTWGRRRQGRRRLQARHQVSRSPPAPPKLTT